MKLIYSISLLFFSIAYVGCSRGKVCTLLACGFPEGGALTFSGYALSEVDTFYITGYQVNSNFTKVETEQYLDSPNSFPSGNHEENSEDANEQYYYIDASHDWELVIPATNETFRVSGYKYGIAECNKCASGRKDLHSYLKSFDLNGEQIGSAAYTITR